VPVIGTAGHVDHGKSTLIQSLTGRDPDRWEEEKRRGLTIDLGFSWMTLPSGVEVSFVDVPGHARFAKNMLAGVEAIDVALFVVSVEEGWMPQSEEHLAVLDLLSVNRGVVALTKADRVGPEAVEKAVSDIAIRTAGTGLASSPVIPVSTVTGQGMTELISALDRHIVDLDAVASASARMWIDRVFTISGSGTVVTGTLLDGPLDVGDAVELWPGPFMSRVRNLESHEQSIERAEPRRRVAINLAGVERQRLRRGTMLGQPNAWLPTHKMSAVLTTARYEPPVFVDRGSFHVHLGTSATDASIRVVDDGPPTFALIELAESRPVKVGDRFIIRDVGRRRVVAGGTILDPEPARKRQAVVDQASEMIASLEATPDEIATVLLHGRGRDRVNVLAAHSGGGHPIAVIEDDGWAISAAEAQAVRHRAVSLVEDHQREHPLAGGISTAELASRNGIGVNLLTRVLEGTTDLTLAGSVVTVSPGGQQRAEDPNWQVARDLLAEAGLAPPALTTLKLDRDLVAALTREGSLVRVSDEFVYLPEQLEGLVALIRGMPAEFTVSEFRQRAGLTRKHAVPLLEWADRKEVTVRIGDRRRVVSRT
jgi:selenocysteine-specific elongation factor